MSEDDTPDGWTPEQQRLFARLFRHMEANQAAFTHPGMPELEADHWKTIAWNASWMAAHTMLPDAPYIIHEGDNGEVIGAEVRPEALQ